MFGYEEYARLGEVVKQVIALSSLFHKVGIDAAVRFWFDDIPIVGAIAARNLLGGG